MTQTEPREMVQTFAELMERVLQLNDHKGDFNHMTVRDFQVRIDEEANEVRLACIESMRYADFMHRSDPDMLHRVIKECADVANFGAALLRLVNSIQGNNPYDPEPAPAAAPDGQSDNRISVTDPQPRHALHSILKEAGTPMSRDELLTRLVERGTEIKARDPLWSIGVMLASDPVFEYSQFRQLWGLRAWTFPWKVLQEASQ